MRTLVRTSSFTLLKIKHRPSSLQQNSSHSHLSRLSQSYPSTLSNENSQFDKHYNGISIDPHFTYSPNLPKPTSKVAPFPHKNVQSSSLYQKTILGADLLQKCFKCRPFCSDSGKQDENSSTGHIDAGSSIRKPVSLWPGVYHSPVTNTLWEARSRMYEKPQAGNYLNSGELLPKTPAQSRTGIVYKFSDDYELREEYRNPWNKIRIGKLLEDFDALAGIISFKLFEFSPC